MPSPKRHRDFLDLEALEERILLSVAQPLVEQDAVDMFATSPAVFVENLGQWTDESVAYGFEGGGAAIAFRDDGLEFRLSRRIASDSDVPLFESQSFGVSFDGANATAPVGLDQADSYFNYCIGDQSTWREGVPGYATVAYEDLYEGIDLLTFGQRGNLKYEFHVDPGVDYMQVRISYEGADGLLLDGDGNLHVQTAFGDLVDAAPIIYQDIDGERITIDGSFVLLDADTVGFAVLGAYDPSRELVLDPSLDWSTYVGGTGDDEARGIALDGAGGIYVTGYTVSSGWTSGGYDTEQNGNSDAFVAKLTDSGGHVWSTYLGGSNADYGWDIASDGTDVYVAGYTLSSSWVSGGYDVSHNGSSDGFAAKLTSAGAHSWSTYIGSGGVDYGYGIATDGLGDVYVTGYTNTDAWVSGGYDTSYNGGGTDAFVVAITDAGTHSWSTYLGGVNSDYGYGITADGAGGVYVMGGTASDGWVSGGYDVSHNGNLDAYVAALTDEGEFSWGTYVGGSSDEYGYGIATDGQGNLYATGYTKTDGWVSGGCDTSHNGGTDDAFVVALTDAGEHSWSTYLGGTGTDTGYDVAASDGAVYVTGCTMPAAWVSGGFDTTHNGNYDAFIVALTESGEHGWSSYMGGDSLDQGYGIAVDDSGAIAVAGTTLSSTWVSGGYDTSYNGGKDAFVAYIEPVLPTVGSLSLIPATPYHGQTLYFFANSVADGDTAVQQVVFYRDANDNGTYDDGVDPAIGSDTDSAGGWTDEIVTQFAWGYGETAFFARAQDELGLWSDPVSNTVEIQGYTSATPGAPDLVSGSDTGLSDSDDITNLDNSSGEDTLVFSVGSTQNGATVTIYADGTAIGSAVASGSTTLVTTNGSQDLTDGDHSITARQTEFEKLESADSTSLTVTVDTTPPAYPPASIPDLLSASDTGVSSTDGITSDTTPTFFTYGDYWRMYRSGELVSGMYETVASFTDEELADGTYNYMLYTVDVAGNTGENVAQTVVIDTTPPDAPDVPDLQAASDTGVSSTDNLTNNFTPTFDLSGYGTYYRVYRNGALISGSYGTTATYTEGYVGTGSYSYAIRAVDAAGNESSWSESLNMTVDLNGPTIDSAYNGHSFIDVTFSDSRDMDEDTVVDIANYALTASGGDGTFGDGNELDESEMIRHVTYTAATKTVRLHLGPWLDDDTYRVTVNGTSSVRDAAGNALNNGADGDVDIAPDDLPVYDYASQAPTGLMAGSSNWGDSCMSADGRYVAFGSSGWGLAENDTYGGADVFVFDRLTQTVELISVDSDENQGDGDSRHPTISADGRYVAFRSASQLAPDAPADHAAVYVRDRELGTTEYIGPDAGGWWEPSISADGRYVAFVTDVADFFPGDTNGRADIFVYDRDTDSVTRVNTTAQGEQATVGDSDDPFISSDGRYVAFTSYAGNLVPGDSGYADIFVKDLQTGAIERVSVTSAGGAATGSSFEPCLSRDGRYVVFTSYASNLAASDTNGARDVFLHDRTTGETVCISAASEGVAGNAESTHPWISGDGERIVFRSYASNLVADDTNGEPDVFFADLDAATLARLNLAADGSQSGTNTDEVAISPDGRYVSFHSEASDLIAGGANGRAQIWVRDLGERTDGVISDFVWSDYDLDGIQDADEPGLNGVTVNLLDGGTLAQIATTTTADGGLYAFRNLFDGEYVVEFVRAVDQTFSPANEGGDDDVDSDADEVSGRTAVITISEGSNFYSVDAGMSPPPSATPSAPDLDADYDTGVSSSDNITAFDNASGEASRLRFTVGGTVAGATVTLYADSVAIGSAVASGTSTTVWTNGAYDLSDGAHAFTAMQREVGKADSDVTTALSVTVDTEAPETPNAPDLQADSDSGASATDNLTGHSPMVFDLSGFGEYCTVYRNGQPVSDTFWASSEYEQSSLSDGTYQFKLRARDAAGNASELSEAVTVTVDTLGPVLNSYFGEAGRVVVDFNETNGLWNATMEDLDNWSLFASGGDGTFGDGNEVDHSAAIYYVMVRDASRAAILPFAYRLDDEAYRLVMKGTSTIRDLAGNALAGGNDVSVDWIVDEDATPTVSIDLDPVTDSGASDSDHITNQTRPQFNVTVSEAGFIEVDYDGDGTYDASRTVSEAGTYAFTPSVPLTRVDTQAVARFTDTRPNETSDSVDYVIDTAGPALASHSTWVDHMLLTFSDDNGMWESTVVDAANYVLTNSGGDTTFDDGNEFDVSDRIGDIEYDAESWVATMALDPELIEGRYGLTLKGTATIRDIAGNALNDGADSFFSVVVDDEAPEIIIEMQSGYDQGPSSSDGITNLTAPVYDVTINEPGRVQIDVDGDGSYEYDAVRSAAGTFQFTPDPLGDGNYPFYARLRDTANNLDTDSYATVIDTVAPDAPTSVDLQNASDSGLYNDDNLTNVARPWFNVTYDADRFQFFIDDVLQGARYKTGTSYQIGADLAEGSHEATAKAVDLAGNESAESDGVWIDIDRTAPGAPAAPTLNPADADGVITDTTPTFDVAAGGAHFRLYRDGTLVSQPPLYGDDGYPYRSGTSETLSPQPYGVYDYTATLVDLAGNESVQSAALSVTLTDMVQVATNLYGDGVRVTLYSDNGAAAPDVAWDPSQYVPGTTDVYVVPGAIGDAVIPLIYLIGNDPDTDGLGIIVSGANRVSTFNDARSAGDLAFLGVEGDLTTAIFRRPVAGGRFNGIFDPGGWGFSDVDNDGDVADAAALSVEGNVGLAYFFQGLGADVGVRGSVSRALVIGEAQGDVYVSGNVTLLQAMNQGAVGFSGNITIDGHASRLISYGDIDGDVIVWNGLDFLSVASSLNGFLGVDGDLRTAVVRGNVSGGVEVTGNLTTMLIVGGRVAPAGPTLGISVGGDLGVFRMVGYAGGGSALAGFLEVAGNATLLLVQGGVALDIGIGGNLGTALLFGDVEGGLYVDGGAGVVKIVGGALGDGAVALDVGGNLNVFQTVGYSGGGNVVKGDVTVDGLLNLFYVTGGNVGGTLSAGAINTAYFFGPGGITNPVETNPGGGQDGHVNMLYSRLGVIAADVTIRGHAGRIYGMGGGITGNVVVEQGCDFLYSIGALTGDVTLTGGNLTRLTVINRGGNALVGNTVDVRAGSITACTLLGNFSDASLVADALNVVKIIGSTVDTVAPDDVIRARTPGGRFYLWHDGRFDVISWANNHVDCHGVDACVG